MFFSKVQTVSVEVFFACFILVSAQRSGETGPRISYQVSEGIFHFAGLNKDNVMRGNIMELTQTDLVSFYANTPGNIRNKEFLPLE